MVKTIFQKKDKILIVGATGFIGHNLMLRCLKHTANITCLGLPETNKLVIPKKVKLLNIDLRDRNKLKSSLSGLRFDYVFNLGGYIDHAPYLKGGRRLIEAHFIGLLNLIDSLEIKFLKKFIQIGTSDEYGNAPSPQDENAKEIPISPYSLAKMSCTKFIQMLSKTEGFPGVALRLFLVYGPGQSYNRFLPQIIDACLKNKEFNTSKGTQLRDFCYVDDVIEGIIRSAISRKTIGEIINIASGRKVQIKEIINKTTRIAKGGIPKWGKFPYRKSENMSLYADIEKAYRLLNWKSTTSLNEGLNKTIDYYKQRV